MDTLNLDGSDSEIPHMDDLREMQEIESVKRPSQVLRKSRPMDDESMSSSNFVLALPSKF